MSYDSSFRPFRITTWVISSSAGTGNGLAAQINLTVDTLSRYSTSRPDLVPLVNAYSSSSATPLVFTFFPEWPLSR